MTTDNKGAMTALINAPQFEFPGYEGVYVRALDYLALCGDYAALLAVQSAQAVGTTWQPIETAPKDGTPLILFARYFHATASIVCIGDFSQGQWRNQAFSGSPEQTIVPSHWMPRPPFPRVTAAVPSESATDEFVTLFRESTGDYHRIKRTDLTGISELLQEGWCIPARKASKADTAPEPIHASARVESYALQLLEAGGFCTQDQIDSARRIATKYVSSTIRASDAPTDDAYVMDFAEVMKAKMVRSHDKGRGGWQDCSPDDLSRMLHDHVEKGDPVDVANFCMMLYHLGRPIAAHTAPAVDAVHAATPMVIDLEDLKTKLLTPRQIVRDEDGMFYHPDMPILPESMNMREFLALFGLETAYDAIEDAASEISERYFEAGEPDCSYWAPTPPRGDGWMLIYIFDTGDGPCAWYVRDAAKGEAA